VELEESTYHYEGNTVVDGELVEWTNEQPYTSASLARGGVRERINLEVTGSLAVAMLSAVMD
jgi:hypothetical protein